MLINFESFLATLAVIFLASPLLAYYVGKWHWGLIGCILYIPISGYVSILLHRHAVALQAKDFFFLIPAYIGFSVFLQSKIRFSGIPNGFTLAAMSFVFLVILQTVNFSDHAPSMLGVILGIKVWTFYLPLIMITYIYVSDPQNLVFLVRAVVISSWIPTVVGIIQYTLARVYGFEQAMKFWYGDFEAASVTFGFGEIETTAGVVYRLPSTFTFITQYSYFLLAAFCFALIAVEIEKTRFWRVISYLTVLLLMIAALTSGARFLLFVYPLTLVSYYMIKRGAIAGIVSVIGLVILNLISTISIGFNPWGMAKHFSSLINDYIFEWIPKTLKMAVLSYPLGSGTGAATPQIRHLGAHQYRNIIQSEGYFQKAIIELGIPGLIIVFALMIIPIIVNLVNLRRTRDSSLRAIICSVVVFQTMIFFQCFKGNVLDQDPTNVFFWITVGISFRINSFLNFQRTQASVIEPPPSTSISMDQIERSIANVNERSNSPQQNGL